MQVNVLQGFLRELQAIGSWNLLNGVALDRRFHFAGSAAALVLVLVLCWLWIGVLALHVLLPCWCWCRDAFMSRQG